MDRVINESFRIRATTPRVFDEAEEQSPAEDQLPLSDALESLINLTGFPASSFATLEKLEIKIDAEEHPVYEFGQECPNVRELRLNGSRFESIRDLGIYWEGLQILWVVRCGLNELEGLSAMPNLKELYAAFNCIKSLSALMYNDNLEILDLEGNEIVSWDEIAYLSNCDRLDILNLSGNPISAEK